MLFTVEILFFYYENNTTGFTGGEIRALARILLDSSSKSHLQAGGFYINF